MEDIRAEENVRAVMIFGGQSQGIGKLAKAMAAAQGQLNFASKDAANPFFKSKYATLAAVYAACKDALSKNNIAVFQVPETIEGGTVVLKTILAHESGEWIAGTYPVISKDRSAQGVGSGMTYARRYSLAAMVGVAQDDDDGNAAQGLKKDEQVDATQAQNKMKTVQSGAPKSSQYKGSGVQRQTPAPKPKPQQQQRSAKGIENMPNMADELNDLFGA